MLNRSYLGGLQIEISGGLWRIVRGRELPRGAFELVRDGVRRNPQQPRRKRHSAPLITRQVRQRSVKHFGSQLLSGSPVPHTGSNKRVDPLELQLVQSIEFRRITLRGLHEDPLLGTVL